MSRRHVPGTSAGDGLNYAAVVARVDALEGRAGTVEEQLDATSTDVEALGRGLGQLNALLSNLPGSTPGPAPVPQPARCWLTVSDPAIAHTWLDATRRWVEEVLGRMLLAGSIPRCWPWHPAAVVHLFALHDTWAAGYGSGTPTAVSDVLLRWLPQHRDQLAKALGKCSDQRGHLVVRGREERHMRVTLARLGDYVRWWCDPNAITGDDGMPPGVVPHDPATRTGGSR